MKKKKLNFYIDPITKKELDKVKHVVTKKDRDFVLCIDGEEGSGKSVLALQFGAYLDKNFSIDNVCFNADQFIDKLRKSKQFSCIILDEAFSSANSRQSLTEVNRSLIAVATEMRQRNLYVIIVIPSFFDLDRYFALWRTRALFHVYFNKEGGRGSYIMFPRNQKKYLYLTGKKQYNYSKPASPYPVLYFNNYYSVNEKEYRKKKEEAFKKRVVSFTAVKWKGQRDALINEMYHNRKVPSIEFEKIFLKWGKIPISQREIQNIVSIYGRDEGEVAQ